MIVLYWGLLLLSRGVVNLCTWCRLVARSLHSYIIWTSVSIDVVGGVLLASLLLTSDLLINGSETRCIRIHRLSWLRKIWLCIWVRRWSCSWSGGYCSSTGCFLIWICDSWWWVLSCIVHILSMQNCVTEFTLNHCLCQILLDSVLDDWVFEDGVHCGASGWVCIQEWVQQLPYSIAISGGNWGVDSSNNLHWEHLERWSIKWNLECQHLVQHDPHRPHISAKCIWLGLYNLWWQIVRGSNTSSCLLHSLLKYLCNT